MISTIQTITVRQHRVRFINASFKSIEEFRVGPMPRAQVRGQRQTPAQLTAL
jgi:hypothetical protein